MPQNQTMICNLALSRIGHQHAIANIDERSSAAAACKAVYDWCVEEMQRKRPWPFTQRYVELALVEENPNDDWGFSYRYPSNFLRVGALVPRSDASGGATLPSPGYRVYNQAVVAGQYPFVLSSDVAGKLIFSDLETPMAYGTYHVDDEGLFDSSFVDGLAWKLASEIAMSLSKDSGIRNICRAESDAACSQAFATASNERVGKPEREGSMIEAMN